MLLAESNSLGKEKGKPELKPTRFVDPPPRFWTDNGNSWQKDSPTTES